MPNIKISQLNPLTTPIGTDVFPIVNSGETKKITFDNLSTALASSTASALSDGGQLLGYTSMSGHIIPTDNATYDLGNAEYKIRHLYLSPNSLFIGDTSVSENDYLNKATVSDAPPPVAPTDPGVKGEIRTNSSHMYICVAPNVWKRALIEETW